MNCELNGQNEVKTMKDRRKLKTGLGITAKNQRQKIARLARVIKDLSVEGAYCRDEFKEVLEKLQTIKDEYNAKISESDVA